MFDWTRLPFFVPLMARINQGMYNNMGTEDMPFVNVSSGTVTSDKTNRLDARVITNGIYCWNGPMYDIDNARRESCSLTKLGNNHCRTRITLGWL
jgi:hypothetical protein